MEQERRTPGQRAWQPSKSLRTRWLERVGRLAGHRQCWSGQWPAPRFVRAGAGVRTLPRAEQRGRMGHVVRKRRAASQHSLQPAASVRARRVARVEPLAQPQFEYTSAHGTGTYTGTFTRQRPHPQTGQRLCFDARWVARVRARVRALAGE